MSPNDFGVNRDLWQSIGKGTIIGVKSKSQLGANRVREHGMLWRVKAFKGYNLLTFSTKTGYKRWIMGPNDKDFIVVSVYDKGFKLYSGEAGEDGH